VTTISCADVAELFDELALDTLPGDVRALALGHLAGCTSCRTAVEELSATADALLLAAPRVEPPEGFDLRVRKRVHDCQPDRDQAFRPHRALRRQPPPQPQTRPQTHPQRQPRRRPRLIGLAGAAAAAVAVVVALAGGGILVAGSGSQHGNGLAAGVLTGKDQDLRTAKLIAADGKQLGDVSVYAGSPAWFFMRVDRGQLTTSYRCVLDIAGGSSVGLGNVWVSHGKGAWGQHVDLHGRQVRAARLVDDAGRTLASATFA
jgi:anti-sigma factor RsiW